MTTAHRATWTPAKGGKDNSLRGIVPSKQISSKDIPGHTKLKIRQPGQNTKEEVERSTQDLRDSLQERELKLKNKEQLRAEEERPVLAIEARKAEEELSRSKERQRLPKNIDADDSDDSSDDSSDEEEEGDSKKRREDDDEDDSDSDSDDEDEEAELMREMEKIRREREEEALRKKRQEEDRERRQREAAVMTSNPLLSTSNGGDEDGFTVKRKWFDDGIFKNQAKGVHQPKKRFINDTVRNDFHRKFLDKYVQ